MGEVTDGNICSEYVSWIGLGYFGIWTVLGFATLLLIRRRRPWWALGAGLATAGLISIDMLVGFVISPPQEDIRLWSLWSVLRPYCGLFG